ncbi:hypothetical protein [Marinilabilia salmonicolor]|uniref:Uncharacterized protein n=1 Tax=Marinilabilia salmonicolor TaxID=989 RepID=A0A368VBR1_9BACT|nr:hypothetical protein [Marinilabilia salmonicolor]RCW38556.1 hypothetical protein DFO77_10321 [Marinilabilia salmonicolor]
MKNNGFRFILLTIIFIALGFYSRAEGISVDAGLTPAQDRIIVRLQYRSIINRMGGNEIRMHMMPLVVAYGLTPDVTVMMRNAYRDVVSNETMMQMDNRFMDPFLMGKMKLYRKNTRHYSLGVAGFVGSTFPVLRKSAANTFSPVIGVNSSFRPGLWSFDLNNAYEWVNYNTSEKEAAAGVFQVNLAISRNILLPGLENWILSPVQEFSLINNNPVAGESNISGFVSPGFQVVSPHLKIEGLYQIAVNDSQSEVLQAGNRVILGLRFMF